MMPPLALALALVLAPPAAGPEASGAPPAASGARALLDEKITLNLKDADLGQVLDRLATLLGKTLILQPGIDGTVTIDIREAPVSEVLASLQTSHALSIRLEGERMYVTKAGEKLRRGPGKPDEEGLDLAFLADTSLPRRLASDKPKRFDGSFEIRAEDGTGVWEIGGSLGTVTLPGCAGPLPVILLPGDFFDGVPRVVFGPARGGAGLARSVAPGGTVRLPDCSAPLTLKALDSRDGASKAVPVSQAGQYQLAVKILEAGARDELLSAPSIAMRAGEVAALQSKDAGSHDLLGQGVHMNVAVLDMGETDALLVCSVSVTRDVEPARGEPPVTIRIARADESLRLTYGKPERVTVSPTYGRGYSSLVLELTLERLAEKRRGR
jgi:hypothetical protein